MKYLKEFFLNPCLSVFCCILAIGIPALAQVYEKSGTSLKVTRQVEESYAYSDMVLKVQDLKDMKGEVTSRYNAEIARLDEEIAKYQVMIAEAEKLGIDKPEEKPIEP
jgi:hypothetical protein